MKKNRTVLGVDLDVLSPPEPKPLREGILGTVPDFKVEEAVDLLVERLAQITKAHILQDRSKDPVQRNQAIGEAQVMLKSIKEEVLEVVQNKLLSYSRR